VLQFQAFTAEYVECLTRGDPETECHFVVYFAELLRIKLRKALCNPQAIEDIRQETFFRVLNVLRHKQGLANPEKLGAFVNGVCRNVLIEYYRSVSRHSPGLEPGFDVAGSALDPEAEYVNEERKQGVRNLLDRLPAKDRQILQLIFMEERDKDEVCRICDVDRGYLRVLLHRAKNRVRQGIAKKTTATSGSL
jgi:RNA polymerase sigma-70 factor, ECF subfamily